MKYPIKIQITRFIPVFPLSEFLLPNTISSLPLGLALHTRMSLSLCLGPATLGKNAPVHAFPSHSDLILGPYFQSCCLHGNWAICLLGEPPPHSSQPYCVTLLHGGPANLFPALILNVTPSAMHQPRHMCTPFPAQILAPRVQILPCVLFFQLHICPWGNLPSSPGLCLTQTPAHCAPHLPALPHLRISCLNFSGEEEKSTKERKNWIKRKICGFET